MNTEEKKPFEVRRFQYFLETCFATKKEEIVAWLQYCMVHVDKKAPTALVLASPKNETDESSLKTLLHVLGMYIYNDEVHKKISYKEIMSTSNEYVRVKKLLVIKEDVFKKAQKENKERDVLDKIYYLVDNDTIVVRKKNKNPRNIINSTKIIIASDIFMEIVKKENAMKDQEL